MIETQEVQNGTHVQPVAIRGSGIYGQPPTCPPSDFADPIEAYRAARKEAERELARVESAIAVQEARAAELRALLGVSGVGTTNTVTSAAEPRKRAPRATAANLPEVSSNLVAEVLEAITASGDAGISRNDLAAQLTVDTDQIASALLELKAGQKILSQGKARGTKYFAVV